MAHSIKSVFFAGIIGLTPLPLQAADALAPQQVVDWTGAHIGADIGGAFADSSYNATVGGAGRPFDFEPSGVIGGGHIGYDIQSGNFVFGAEAAISATDLSDTVSNAFVSFTSDVDWLARFTGRIGWAQDEQLVYARGGYAVGQMKTTGANLVFPFGRLSGTTTHNGYTAGAGVERMFGEHLSFGAEYNYVHLGDQTFSGTTRMGTSFTMSDINADIHAITARLSWRFGSN